MTSGAVVRSSRTAPTRTRRRETDRKARIIDVTLDVIAEHGVARTTHRLIAAAADVPLGSVTYYFSSLDDLIEQAFTLHADRMTVLYRHYFDEVATRDDLVDAITDLIRGNNAGSQRDSAISFELYLAALRNPALRSVTDAWMAASRTVLRRYLDATAARGVDALIEGLIIHLLLSTRAFPRTHIRDYVDRAVGDSVRPGALPTSSNGRTP